MCSEFDHFGPETATVFFENASSKDALEYRHNRRLLFWAMAAAGFTNYREEWWHFDYGNQFWGVILNQPARYGFLGEAAGG
jgi:D-alanyl-D-alanine dipeptidase